MTETELRELTAGFVPWNQWVRPVAESKVALVATAGVYLKHGLQEPYDDGRPGGDPSFREFPVVVRYEDLAVAGPLPAPAREDLNLVFPLERLRAMAESRAIDAVAPFAYSFSGTITDPVPLLAGYGPSVAYRIRRMGADVALVCVAGGTGRLTAALVARLIELAGVPTVVLDGEADGLRGLGIPRGVAIRRPAAPGDAEGQQRLLRAALEAAWGLHEPGVVEL
ncbi:hypothetical protein [Symbiobacterium thermophilum]|uniref:hypothetical protein n=1 Tax=Symbiobacterium thermophilum TaxID=2734 RepID=UPI0035C6BC18